MLKVAEATKTKHKQNRKPKPHKQPKPSSTKQAKGNKPGKSRKNTATPSPVLIVPTDPNTRSLKTFHQLHRVEKFCSLNKDKVEKRGTTTPVSSFLFPDRALPNEKEATSIEATSIEATSIDNSLSKAVPKLIRDELFRDFKYYCVGWHCCHQSMKEIF